MPDPAPLLHALEPIARSVAALDLGDPEGARRCLEETWPATARAEVERLLGEAQDAGWLTPRRASPELTFGRLAKASPETFGLSYDVVDMGGAGGAHTHPNGEVSLCIARDGEPRFCGHPAGWVVVPPDSWHVPEVTGGRMLILYFLPGGAITFDQP